MFWFAVLAFGRVGAFWIFARLRELIRVAPSGDFDLGLVEFAGSWVFDAGLGAVFALSGRLVSGSAGVNPGLLVWLGVGLDPAGLRLVAVMPVFRAAFAHGCFVMAEAFQGGPRVWGA